jgi:radical SAM superfamily enzyme YgiQ (UPF0313 family)
MKNQNILLINPWIYDFAAYDFWIKPIGLLSIGSILEKFGYKTSLIDCLDRFHPLQFPGKRKSKALNRKYGSGKFYREPVEKPKILADIPRLYCRYGLKPNNFNIALSNVPRPDVVLVTSTMTYWYPGPFKVIELVKQKYPRVPIVLGGIYASLFNDHAKQLSGADYVVKGAGEEQALKLVDELTGNRSDWSKFPQNWQDLPEPVYYHYQALASLPIITSKGCPYRCSFCASLLLSGKFVQQNPDRIFQQIEYYYRRQNVRHFAFWDDALLINHRSHLSKILQAVIAKKLHITFHTPNGIHAREVDAELAKLMFLSNFKTIRLSYETSNKLRQQEMNLKVSDEALTNAIDFFEKAGIKRKDIDVYVIMGLPGQSIEEVVQSMLFVISLGAKVRLSSFSPIPGTVDWDRAVKDYGFPADADPLLTNNSIYPLRTSEITYHHYQQLRHLSKALNYSLDQGINFFNSSSLAKMVWANFTR